VVVNFRVAPVGISSLDGVLGTHIFTHVANVLPEDGWLLLTTFGSLNNIVGGHPSTTEVWISCAAWALAAIAVIAFLPGQRDAEAPFRGCQEPRSRGEAEFVTAAGLVDAIQRRPH
jgi:hypothetical protein